MAKAYAFENSHFPPTLFSIGKTEFMVGAWTHPFDGQPYFNLVADKGDGFRDQYFLSTPLSPKDIVRFGGLHAYLLRHFVKWKKVLIERHGMEDEDWFLEFGKLIAGKITVSEDSVEFDLSKPSQSEIDLAET